MEKKTVRNALMAVLLVAIPVLSSCTDETTPPPTTTAPQQETLLPTVAGIDATLVYASKCASCHGSDRQGGVGPSLQQDITIAFLSQWVPVHRTGVGLDSRLRDVLINWLKTNSTVSTEPKPTDPVFIYALNCTICHGDSRQGGIGGPSIELTDLTRFDAGFLSIFLQGHFHGVDLIQSQRDALAEWLKAAP